MEVILKIVLSKSARNDWSEGGGGVNCCSCFWVELEHFAVKSISILPFQKHTQKTPDRHETAAKVSWMMPFCNYGVFILDNHFPG